MNKRLVRKTEPYLWILPSIVLMATFIIVPIFHVFKMAFSEVSKTGKIRGFAGFDNFTKVLNSSAFEIVLKNTIIWTIVVVVLSREFLVTGLRLLAVSDGVVIAADKTGKFKTAFQMFALIIGGAGWVKLFGFDIFNPTVWKIWYAVMLLVVFFTLYSGISYFVKNYKLITNKL